MPDVGSFKTGVTARERRLTGVVDRHKVAIVVGGAVGVTAGVVANVLVFLLVYVWPWSVLIGCEQ